MKRIPFEVGTIHFTGIGGIGMSGIAVLMNNLGYAVQGSDISENANVERLRKMGIAVHIGHDAAHVKGTSAVVISSAIKDANPEIRAARAARIPVVRRADMLAELMRLKNTVSIAGTHGKTTTTSMVAAVMDAGGHDPTVINGGIINSYGTNARLGEGDWMVVEADESDGSFIRLPATLAVVTNIDPEHLDFYGDFDAIKEAFITFVERVPFYGAAILCVDHPVVQSIIPRIRDRHIITYGTGRQADIRAVNLDFREGAARFDVEVAGTSELGGQTISSLVLPMPGEHNVSNALAAVAVGLKMGMGAKDLRKAFADFAGVKRRFTITGEARGITVVDDYGHHPVEIAAVLRAARQAYDGRIVAVAQPHRYTRLSSLFDEFCTCFNDADAVVVAPVFEAGEDPIEGATHEALAEGIRSHGHKHVYTIEGEGDLAGTVMDITAPGDIVVCLGAGSITKWAHALPGEIRALAANDNRAGGSR